MFRHQSGLKNQLNLRCVLFTSDRNTDTQTQTDRQTDTDTHYSYFRVELIEVEELESKQYDVILQDTLLHQRT